MSEAARVLGQRYVVLLVIPASERQNLDGYRRMADTFNQIGAQAAKLGNALQISQPRVRPEAHRRRGPVRVADRSPDGSRGGGFADGSLLGDRRGADWIAYLQRYKGRYKSLHVKDMAKPVRFAGDGGDSSQWIALFPFITDAGRGCA